MIFEGGPQSQDPIQALPEIEQEKLKKSWASVEALISDIEKLSVQGANVAKIEQNDSSVKDVSQEIYDFYSTLFEGEENADPMQIEIGISEGIVDTYIARDNEGKIASLLQSQRVEVPPAQEGQKPELMFLVWYVGTDKNYRGKPLTRDLFLLAMKDLLKKSKEELKPIKAFVGETEDEVEGMFNRYGLNRIYYKDKNGSPAEVPFECPPEDESKKGVPEHLMVRLLDERKTMSPQELMNLVDSIYGQYTRQEYFTVEYLKYSQEFYKEDLDALERNIPITSLTAKRYFNSYKKIVTNIRNKLQKTMSGVEGELFFKSRRERRAETAGDATEQEDSEN